MWTSTDTTARHYRGKESLENRTLNEIPPSILLPSEFRELMEEKAEELGDTERMEDTKETS